MKTLNDATARIQRDVQDEIAVIDQQIRTAHERANFFRARIQTLRGQIESDQVRVRELEHAVQLAKQGISTKQAQLAEAERQLSATIREDEHA